MALDNHDNRLPVGLTADEYLFVRDQAEAEGLSQAALVRRLINEYRRHVALGQLSVNERYETSAKVAHEPASQIDDQMRAMALAMHYLKHSGQLK